MTTMRHLLTGLLSLGAVLSVAAQASAAIISELEPNETKATATPAFGLLPGDSLFGATTGSGSAAGLTSRDFFRLKMAPDVPGIYRYQLTLTTGGTAGHVGAIMGTAQSGAASDTTTVQTSSTLTTPARMNQWFGFGLGEELYYRVTGGPTTTSPYSATLTRTTVTPTALGDFAQGGFTISTVGQTATDTEMYLFDSAFNLVEQNDDEPAPATSFQSTITRALTPGVYYLALANFNTATSAANIGPVDRSTSGNRLDFPNLIARGSTTSLADLDFTIDTDGDASVALPVTASAPGTTFDMYWATFRVTPEPSTIALLGLASLAVIRRRRAA